MSRINGVVIGFGLIWIAIKMGFHIAGEPETGFTAGVMVNIMFVLLVAYWALKEKYKTPVVVTGNGIDPSNTLERKLLPADTHFLDDLKTALKAAGKYVLIITAFIFIYYSYINAGFLESKVDQVKVAVEGQVATDENWEKVQSNDPFLEDKTKEDYVEGATDAAREWYSPSLQTTLSLFALMMMAVFYSLLLVLLFRKVLYRKQSQQ